jgi:hypothetical protein
MNTHFFTLLLSLVTFTSIFADHHYATFIVHYEPQSQSRSFKENRSHHDFSHESTYNNPGCDRSPSNNHQFSKYTTTRDFQEHFTAHGYTENQILNQRCLYMFDEFVKFAQTYSAYKCTIQQLHAELKNLNVIQKAWYKLQGSYCHGLQKRIHYLYNQLNTIKIAQSNSEAFSYNSAEYKKHVDQFIKNNHSLTAFREQLPEYNTLESTYHTNVPLLSKAIEERVEAYNSMSNTDAAQYVSKPYNLNNNVKQLLHKHGQDTARFTECFGTKLDHAIHHEALDILDRVGYLSPHSILYDHQDALVDFAVAIVDYNHEGLTDKATQVADLCWTLLDYGQAVVEGSALGVYSAASDIVNNPIEATLCMIAGKQVLAYQFCKVLYNIADIGITAITDGNHAKDKWNKYAEPLNNIIDAINKKEISLRDAIKGGTTLTVGLIVQSKLLGGLGKFCNTIKQKSINFIQKNPLLKPQEYLATPEGLLFKATKMKQPGQSASTLNLKSSVENKVAKNNSIKIDKSTTNPAITGSIPSSKGIIRNVKKDLRSTIARYENHIFSDEHKADGILALGKDQETIMNSLYDVIMSIDKKGLLQEGSNQVRVMINGIDNIEVRCFIQNGEVISVNAFISKFNRIFSNFVDITKV